MTTKRQMRYRTKKKSLLFLNPSILKFSHLEKKYSTCFTLMLVPQVEKHNTFIFHQILFEFRET